MANIAVGQGPIKVANVNPYRNTIRFQNAGDSLIYLKRIPLHGTYTDVSSSNFEVVLAPFNSQNGSPEVFETSSMLAYQAVASKCCHIPDPCAKQHVQEDEIKPEIPKKSKKKRCKKCSGLLAITETRRRVC